MAITITVEDGSVVTGANSYVTIAEADEYHLVRGNATWTGTNDLKAAALIRAGQWVNGLRWQGRKTGYSNPMSWPRFDVQNPDGIGAWFDIAEMGGQAYLGSNEVPQAVRNAQCEAALRELASPGSMLPDLSRGGMVRKKRVDILETEYEPGAPGGTTYPAIMALLRGLVGSAGVVEVVRA